MESVLSLQIRRLHNRVKFLPTLTARLLQSKRREAPEFWICAAVDTASSQVKTEARGQHILRVNQAGALATLPSLHLTGGVSESLGNTAHYVGRLGGSDSGSSQRADGCRSAYFLPFICPAHPTPPTPLTRGNLPFSVKPPGSTLTNTLRSVPLQGF